MICKVSPNILSITNFLANGRLIFLEKIIEKNLHYFGVFSFNFVACIYLYLKFQYIYIFIYFQYISYWYLYFQIKNLLNSIWNYFKNMAFNFNKIYFLQETLLSQLFIIRKWFNPSTFSLKKNCLPKLARDFFVERTLK